MRETSCKYSGMSLYAVDRAERTLFEVNVAVLRTMKIFFERVQDGNFYFTFIDDDCVTRRGFCIVGDQA